MLVDTEKRNQLLTDLDKFHSQLEHLTNKVKASKREENKFTVIDTKLREERTNIQTEKRSFNNKKREYERKLQEICNDYFYISYKRNSFEQFSFSKRSEHKYRCYRKSNYSIE